MSQTQNHSSPPKRRTMQFYVLYVYGDVEPHLHGPYPTSAARDEQARALRRENGPEDGIYWLVQDENGKLECGAYSGAMFQNIDDNS